MTDRPVCVLGAGGHAKVVVQTLREAGYDVLGLYDDDPSRPGQFILGVLVKGALAEAIAQRCPAAVIAIGDNRIRKAIVERFPGLRWVPVIHPRAVVAPDVEIGAGAVVFAGAVIQPGTVIGEHVIINTAATVDHDCRVGDFTHLAPGCHLAGDITLEEGVLMGIGSVALPGIYVGAWARIGAGSVVTKSVPSGMVAVGAPARVIDYSRWEHT